MSKNKIQSLIVTHLLKHGQISLILPDGVKLEIGLTQEDDEGNLVVQEDYCWVIATHKDRSTCLDPYNMGLKFSDDEKILVFDDKFTNKDGEPVRRLDVV